MDPISDEAGRTDASRLIPGDVSHPPLDGEFDPGSG